MKDEKKKIKSNFLGKALRAVPYIMLIHVKSDNYRNRHFQSHNIAGSCGGLFPWFRLTRFRLKSRRWTIGVVRQWCWTGINRTLIGFYLFSPVGVHLVTVKTRDIKGSGPAPSSTDPIYPFPKGSSRGQSTDGQTTIHLEYSRYHYEHELKSNLGNVMHV